MIFSPTVFSKEGDFILYRSFRIRHNWHPPTNFSFLHKCELNVFNVNFHFSKQFILEPELQFYPKKYQILLRFLVKKVQYINSLFLLIHRNVGNDASKIGDGKKKPKEVKCPDCDFKCERTVNLAYHRQRRKDVFYSCSAKLLQFCQINVFAESYIYILVL